ncbi:beta and beta-prime subunits of DNA dependent RNA-polymerase, partial [Violaceomyces palustris]
MDITRPITSHIASASFSFLTSEEIRRISVKQIVNPTLLDTTNNPTIGGLHDPALGPMKQHDICGTCHLNSFRCPGHFGHIELPAPVYHPLFMTHMYNLLRGTCLFCHRFKIPEFIMVKYIARLRLLEYGLVEAAEDIAGEQLQRQTNFSATDDSQPKSRSSSAKEDAPQMEDGDGNLVLKRDEGRASETVPEFKKRIEAQVGLLIYDAIRTGKVSRESDKGGVVYSARKKTIAEFMKDVQRKKCEVCQAYNPALRKDGFVKIVERDLTDREKALHEARAIRRPDALLLTSKHANKVKPLPVRRIEEDDIIEDNRVEHDVEDEPMRNAQGIVIDQSADRAKLREARKKSKEASQNTRVVPPAECRANLRLLFRNEPIICSLIFGRHGPFEGGRLGGKKAPATDSLGVPIETANGASADAFFVDVLAVPPTRFRPASVMGDQTFENAQNELLTKILNTSFRVRDFNQALAAISSKKDFPEISDDSTEEEVSAIYKAWEQRKTDAYEKLLGEMVQLQVDVNCFIDSSKNPAPVRQGQLPPPGVKQALEKKEGLFRKHMMGKRVNFAARSVISPDVNIETNEIGVPPVFAQKLTYPEPVTVHNVQLMRQLVINGPNKYPGAVAVRSEDGTETLLSKLTLEARTALANQLLTPQEHTSRQATGTFAGLGSSTRTPIANKQVLRHLRDGDILLLNRQPTLHKPSMMAHKARVLKGEKTIRMHYANCNSYNADFDGDEMNMHFPQSQAARSECYNIANTDNQYLVPTSGSPLRGLIQDHVVAGVWMTCKNSLFSRAEYQQLLYGALRPEENYTGGGRVITLPPAIWRPQPLWTGKQIISTVLLNVKPQRSDGLNLTSKAKVAGRYWGEDHDGEEHVIIRDGELLSGVLDKSQFGASAYGLVHSVYEIYGPEYAGKLLSILSRLFTKFLQHNAFSCRMDDLTLSAAGDKVRRDILHEGRDDGRKAALRSVGLEGKDPKDPDTDRNLRVRLEEVLRDDNKLAALDSEMMSASNNLTSSIIKACIPDGLNKRFPDNNMQMMTVSGAKGSPVNVSQISCLLGPQALEGRRVPVMVSGKTLPSFKPFDTSARAGGFVSGRFLTGIRPQEYYFHCMAGREGLIDTAVKTSRSGYLQRCLIKHLEGIHVHYDHTVRNSDGSILQFQYGEDALDVTKSKYLEQFDFTAENFDSFCKRYDPRQLEDVMEAELAPEHMKKALKKPHKYAPALSVYSPARHFGAMSESFARKVEKYVEENPSNLLGEKKKKKNKKKKGKNDGDDDEVNGTPVEKMKLVKEKLGVEAFRAMAKVLYHRGLVDPGEAVGLLAAQGIGEPSTQMTLNTFHFAGHGAANVTLGIPRLREIVMTASQNIKTPIMRLPVLEGITQEQMKTFCKDGSRLLLSQVVEEAVVTEKISGKTAANGFSRQKSYNVRLNFYPAQECLEEYNTTTSQILAGIEATFVKILENEILRELKRLKRDRQRQAASIGKGEHFSDAAAQANGDDDGQEGGQAGGKAKVGGKATAGKRPAAPGGNDADSEDEDGDSDHGDGDADDAKRKQKAGAHASYEEGSDDEDEGRVKDTEESIEAAFRDDDDSDGSESSDEDDIDDKLEAKVNELEAHLQSTTKFVTSFKFDTRNGSWAELELQLSSQSEKLLLINVVERACRMSVVHE